MAARGATLLLVLCLCKSQEVLSNEDVCQEKLMQRLATLLVENHVEKIEEHIETKTMIKQILQLNLECKNNFHDTLKEIKEEQIGQVEETLKSMQQQLLENTKAINKMLNYQRWLLLVADNKDLKIKNFFSAAGKQFYLENTLMDWYKSREWCQERDMRLLTLKTVPEMAAVVGELKTRGLTKNSFWQSASDINHRAGRFHWPDGTPVDNSTWYPGQPNAAADGKETCGELHLKSANLFDYDCSKTRGILCELPASLYN